MVRLGDRHGGDFGTDLLGEEDALLDGFGGEIRPVGRDQHVLEQCSSPPVSVSFWRLIRSLLETSIWVKTQPP
jgi:hypothetical protein